MTINQALIKYRIPNRTTTEDLETRYSKVLNFDNKVFLAGYYYTGINKPCYFSAVYEHMDDDLTCTGEIELSAVSEIEFFDDGHAIAWAINQ